MTTTTVISSSSHPKVAPESGHVPPWWRREPLSIIELADALHVAKHGRAGFEPQRTVERMKSLNATAAHVFPMGCHLDGNVLFFRHNSPGDPPPGFDYLEEWLRHSIPARLRTIVYFNVHSVKLAHARRHPGWQHRLHDGSPKENVYTIESAFCVNSPWRDWAFDRLRELCAYPIDGIFFDGPVFFDDDCYCAHCSARFQKRCGAHARIPGSEQLDHPLFRELVEFQSDCLCDFLRDSRNVIRETGGREILFYANANPLYPSRINARDNRKFARYVDILAAEGGFLGRDLMTDAPLWKVGMNAKLLEAQASAARVPTLVFDSTTHTPWTSYPLPAGETSLLWASSVAHGAGTWMSCYKDAVDRPGVRAIGPAFQRAARYRRELFDTRSVADVAILVSNATLNYYAGSADIPRTDFTRARRANIAGNPMRELFGWYRALWSAHVPFDVIDDASMLAGDLKRYRVIVLPNVACISCEAAEQLQRFIANGGAILASFETGLYDELGRRRERGMLDELFGIARTTRAIAPPRECDYLLDATARAGCIPSPAFALDVAVVPGANVLRTFSAPLADRYADLAEDSGKPAIVEHARAVYFACDIGAAIEQYRLPEHLALVRELLRKFARPRVRFDNAPPCFEVSLRQTCDGDAFLLHLVNYNGGMTRPIERVLPIHDLHMGVRDMGVIRSIHTLFDEREVAPRATADREWIVFDLPRLDDYQIIRFEIEKKG